MDVLSDVGGIQGLLYSILFVLIYVWNYNHFDNYLTSHLFKVEKKDADNPLYKNDYERSDFITLTRCCNIWHYLVDLTCVRCDCWRKSRRQRGINKAREQMQQEINILEMVKSRRYFHIAMRKLLSKKDRM